MSNKNFFREFNGLVQVLSSKQKRVIWFLGDFSAYLLASFSIYIMFLDIIKLPHKLLVLGAVFFLIIYFLLSSLLKQYNQLNRYRDVMDLAQLFLTVFFSAILAGVGASLLMRFFSYRYILFQSLLTALISGLLRFVWQLVYLIARKETPLDEQIKRVLLLGAGDGGALFMESYRKKPQNIRVVGIIDNDQTKWGQTLGGEKVIGGHQDIPKAVEDLGVDQIIVAIPSMNPENYEEILSLANNIGISVYKMPKVEEVLLGFQRANQNLKKVEIADLLGRPEVDLDDSLLNEELEGKTILITGAGGSIGSEIARQVSRFNPGRLILLGHGENSIYLIYHELIKLGTMTEYVPVIADIQDAPRLEEVLNREKPDIVYHAAAHKHVPLMELNPREALKNNVIGTYNLAQAVDKAGVGKMVMISSDKAVRPPNVMGATKRIAELIITGMNQKSQTTYCAVRFGNVLGSRGSVIPVFERQIAQGGPVTVTDFRMTRYFMTIPEASRLVIHAGANAQGGEVFILDMGQPVKILDLAKKMILLSGKAEREIEIVESGIRPGEKLYEELLVNEDSVIEKIQDKIFLGRVNTLDMDRVDQFIGSLEKMEEMELKRAVITFANYEANESV